MGNSQFLMLLVLILATNIFWAKVCLSLINRLMSKDFSEFAYYSKIKENDKSVGVPEESATSDPESERQAKELNSLFNIA